MVPAVDGTHMRVRFTAEIDHELRTRGEADSVDYDDPGNRLRFTENDIQNSLETTLRWPELAVPHTVYQRRRRSVHFER